MTLIEFLTARLDEDEAVARGALTEATRESADQHEQVGEQPGDPGSWDVEVYSTNPPGASLEELADGRREWITKRGIFMGTTAHIADMSWHGYQAMAEHITCWDPRRVLADVEVKRGILNLHEPYEYDATDDLHCAVCGDVPQVEYPCSTLLVLVQPYAAHPDFDPAWKIPPVMLGDGS